MVKGFLVLVGLLYAGLSLYCAFQPVKASQTVHLGLNGPGGRSEFLTVYGGLEMGMALFFLMPVIVPSFSRPALWACLLIHGCLVLFRAISLMLYQGAFAEVRSVTIGEWVVFGASLALVLMTRTSQEATI
ncbi:hypothetical protein [Rubinisphaera margarita]|uniref:hypothetical protein n=1 Tax=Rubinisphaera margarita TaxID=2909586 RepID=UPI001EE977E2|nr:hypothetical protein [Rubinisphaera margarita]MCG6154355.1 hypothetical protein [Rubinisphaera margarita]